MRAGLLAVAALCAAPLATPAAADEKTPEVSIAVAVAEEGGRPVADEAWIDAAIAEANRLYAAVPLRFRRGPVAPLPARFAAIVTRADRDAAAGRLVRGAINLRVTGALMDVDEPGRVRRGVHWHVRADRRRHFIILSRIAAPGVLAHELGHFFGNPHSPLDDNLMSYGRTGAPVFLDAAQLATIRRALRGYLKSGALRAR